MTKRIIIIIVMINISQIIGKSGGPANRIVNQVAVGAAGVDLLDDAIVVIINVS